MSTLSTTLLILTVLLVLLPTETYAFGAGEIPDFAYLNGKAFRHGDLENILSELAKTAGHTGFGGGLLGLAHSVLTAASGGAKFSNEDVKRVYFGNWLRDYSQAMDIAGLSKLTSDTLVLIVSILGFLTFGFATNEFQITDDRLGVYLPVEHIDNPKGYAAKEGDARNFHPKLRPPVDDRELEIDPRTGMKNYMATENQGWDTSTAHLRRVLRSCIENGRASGPSEGERLYEAYRLLGTGLHTLEDLLAHSNWVEIALRKMGHQEVFCHVGDNVTINTPNGRAPPLVTGTFGGADFLHSLLGEATDHLSQASVVDLSKNLANAANENKGTSVIRDLLKKLPIGGGGDTDDKMSQADVMEQKSKAYQFNPDNIAPKEMQKQLLDLLKWRDDVYRDILKKIEMVPGLADLIDNLTLALNAYVYTILAPYVTPILQEVTSVLGEGSKAVIDTEDQYEVFTNPNASDPSHSLLSKDHFALILNEPAGKAAMVVVRHTVKLIVDAWYDQSIDIDQTINQILESFHHPYYSTGNSRVQIEMFEEVEKWFGGLARTEQQEILQSLTKESVREGKNKRKGSDDDMVGSNQVYGAIHGHSAGVGGSTAYSGGRKGPQGGGYGSSQSNHGQTQGSYGSQARRQEYVSQSGNRQETSGYGSQSQGYGSQGGYGSSGRHDQSGVSYDSRTESSRYNKSGDKYGSGNRYGHSEQTSGRTESSGYGGRDKDSYGSSHKHDDDSYGSRQHESSGRTYGGDNSNTYGSRKTEVYGSGYGGETQSSYGLKKTEGYGSGRNDDDNNTYGGKRTEGYGTDRTHGRDNEMTHSSYGGSSYENKISYGQDSQTSRRKQEEISFGSGYQPSYTTSGSSNYGSSGYGSQSRVSHGDSDNSYGSGRHHEGGGYGSSGYGGSSENRYARDDDHGEGHGSRKKEISGHGSYGQDVEQNAYGGSYNQESSGNGKRSNDSDSYKPSYYGGQESGGHGRRKDKDDSDDDEKKRRRRKNDSESYTSGGHGGGYGGGYGRGSDETYGVERLNVKDSDDEGKHHGRRGKRHDDSD